MKAGLLTSSSMFGKYVPNESNTSPYPYPYTSNTERISAINLKQNYTHERPFITCKFDVPGNRLYLLDTAGVLINLNLLDNSFSTLKSGKIQSFTIDGMFVWNIQEVIVLMCCMLHRIRSCFKSVSRIRSLVRLPILT